MSSIRVHRPRVGEPRSGVAADVGRNTWCAQYLAALFADAPEDAFVELRFRTDAGMGRAFYGIDDVRNIASAVARLAVRTDVYVGVLPRRRQASSRSDLVPSGAVLWVDCDTQDSTDALRDFSPAPSLLVASSGENRHAYWLLREPVSIDIIETANRRLAWLLGADVACADAARILRPAPSRGGNHKHDPPADVCLLSCDTDARYRVDEVVGVVADDDAHVRTVHPSRDSCADDPLLRIEPRVYVERLAGLHVSRAGKVRCPFHDDDTPSLHVYRDPQRGWYCYGCKRGGSIYDFAGLLLGVDTRGRAFVALHRELTKILAA
jgi:CHC2 zinc finger/RepB DNA-primase from phage plasmid